LDLKFILKLKQKAKCFALAPIKKPILQIFIFVLFCTAQPGALPVINKEAVIKTIKLGIALDGKINFKSYFVRKNYFYPDLPKNYQISQYELPLVEGGVVKFFFRR
jgi:aspartyl-tRNA(Asn)/glutamyl-tRNA(Gln) amidotransferase subunit B